jgi:hypothetical protein
MSNDRLNAEWEPAAWTEVGNIIRPADIAILRSIIPLPEFAESNICTICAVFCKAQHPPKQGTAFIEGHQCIGCGRNITTTKVKNWTFES